jgi:hypothetical protein
MEKNTVGGNYQLACRVLYPIMRSGSSVLTTVEEGIQEFEGNLPLEKSPETLMPSAFPNLTPNLRIGLRSAGPLMVEKSYTMEFSEWIEYQWLSSSHHSLLCSVDEELTRAHEGFTVYQAEKAFFISAGGLGSNFVIHSAFSPTRHGEDLYDFCVRNDLAVYLSVAIGLIRDSFPTIKRLRLQLERDPDIEEEWILIDFDVQGEGEDILNQYNRYTEFWVRSVPWPQRDKIRVSFNIE